MSSSSPIAVRTWLGSGFADEQAEPELTATSRIAIISASPSTPSKLRFRFPGSRSVGWPLSRTARRPVRPARDGAARGGRGSRGFVGRHLRPRDPARPRRGRRSAARPASRSGSPRSWPPPSKSGWQPDVRVASADVEGADPLGAVDLVAERLSRSIPSADVERDLADRLGGVGVEEDAALVAEPADRADRVDRADLVVRRHHRDEDGPIGQRGGRRRRPRPCPSGRTGARRDVPALAGEPLEGVEDGLVLARPRRRGGCPCASGRRAGP